MLTYRLFACPGGAITDSSGVGNAYAVIEEDGIPIGLLWEQKRNRSDVLGWSPAAVRVAWPINKHLGEMPPRFHGLPSCAVAYHGYGGGDVVALPDGRKCRLPLTTGGYLDCDVGELSPAEEVAA